jgi:GT2 family glycosyltransferase
MLYVITPVHNRKRLTELFLDSLHKQSHKDFKVIIIDDGSTDGTAEMINTKYNEFTEIINGNGQLWWTKSTNLGIKHVLDFAKDDDFVLTLNNDLLLQKNYLRNIIDCSIKNPGSLIGSLTLFKNEKNKIIFGGIYWSQYTARFMKKFKLGEKVNFNELPETIETDLLPGRGTLIPLEVFDETGLFDEKRFPQYAADYDFSLNAKRKGYRLLICKEAVLYSDLDNTAYYTRYYKVGLVENIRSLFDIYSHNSIKVKYRFARKNAKIWSVYFFLSICGLMCSIIRTSFFTRKKI